MSRERLGGRVGWGRTGAGDVCGGPAGLLGLSLDLCGAVRFVSATFCLLCITMPPLSFVTYSQAQDRHIYRYTRHMIHRQARTHTHRVEVGVTLPSALLSRLVFSHGRVSLAPQPRRWLRRRRASEPSETTRSAGVRCVSAGCVCVYVLRAFGFLGCGGTFFLFVDWPSSLSLLIRGRQRHLGVPSYGGRREKSARDFAKWRRRRGRGGLQARVGVELRRPWGQ